MNIWFSRWDLIILYFHFKDVMQLKYGRKPKGNMHTKHLLHSYEQRKFLCFLGEITKIRQKKPCLRHSRSRLTGFITFQFAPSSCSYTINHNELKNLTKTIKANYKIEAIL